jgi:hypothetical protein
MYFCGWFVVIVNTRNLSRLDTSEGDLPLMAKTVLFGAYLLKNCGSLNLVLAAPSDKTCTKIEYDLAAKQ